MQNARTGLVIFTSGETPLTWLHPNIVNWKQGLAVAVVRHGTALAASSASFFCVMWRDWAVILRRCFHCTQVFSNILQLNALRSQNNTYSRKTSKCVILWVSFISEYCSVAFDLPFKKSVVGEGPGIELVGASLLFDRMASRGFTMSSRTLQEVTMINDHSFSSSSS